MEKATLLYLLVFGACAVLLLVAVMVSEDIQALTTIGFGAIFGLFSIAFTQHLNARAARTKAQEERRQEARGLARALAAEIGIFGHVFMAKGSTLKREVGPGTNGEGTDPGELLRFVELPSRVIFDANASKIALLEVIQEFGTLSEKEEGLVQQVVGFYEGVADLRSVMAAAKLQDRKVSPEEVKDVQNRLNSRAKFALKLSDRLEEFSRSSESQ